MMTLRPEQGAIFYFTSHHFDAATGVAQLGYAIEDVSQNRVDFVEKISFPPPKETLGEDRASAFARALRLLHLIAGMSYYKAAIPPRIVVEGEALDQDTADFLDELYLNGLSEFAYRNGLDLKDRLIFPADDCFSVASKQKIVLNLPDRPLVALGGGKDSLVCLEAVRHRNPIPAVVGKKPLIERVAQNTGLPLHQIGRKIAPELIELNQSGAYNGHVAITAIVSQILVCSAILNGYNAVIMAAERSANEGNLVKIGSLEVNHQYSKSIAFEKHFARLLRSHVAEGIDYFSLLRPLSELAICRLFAKLDRYHRVFSSCNSNFRISGPQPVKPWLPACPTGNFVHLALAPFFPARDLIDIFGGDLLNDPENIPAYDQLIAASSQPKPFECVGEVNEARAALIMLSRNPEYDTKAVVRHFQKHHLPNINDPENIISEALLASDEHLIPPSYEGELRAILES